MRWTAYLFGGSLLALLLVFGARTWEQREPPLPLVTDLPGMEDLSCATGLDRARELTRTEPTEARPVYYWLLHQCADAPELPDVMIETGALLAYHLGAPTEARQVYREFLRKFPAHESAADVLLQLAKLDLDAADYASAVTRLTQLTEQYPNSAHEESARFLADRAAEMLAADRRSVQTPVGRLQQMVPNNPASALMLLVGFVPVVYTASNAVQKYKASRRTSAKLMIVFVIVCIFTNFAFNNFKKIKQIDRVDSEIAALK